MNTYASNVILHGDAGTILKTIPEHTVQMCVTSPPYFGLRDYGIEEQIGLEETPAHYIERLVDVFREVKRVLRKDGTAWINLGDSYGTGTKAVRTQGQRGIGEATQSAQDAGYRIGGQAKQLLGIPWRVAFALQSDGWILRSDIIWHKPNCMPESVTDRPTKSHEYLFLLAKSASYYYDANAIVEPATYYETRNGRVGAYQDRAIFARGDGTTPTGMAQRDVSRRNKRSVWTISTQSYSEAHFATFPPKLIEPCILAGSSAHACPTCRAPWQRVVEKGVSAWEEWKRSGEPMRAGQAGMGSFSHMSGPQLSAWKSAHPDTFLGWQPSCSCPNNDGSGKCVILDPFMGAGTTALVALQHGRRYLGIELNEAYIQLAEKRIAHVQQNLWTSVGEAVA